MTSTRLLGQRLKPRTKTISMPTSRMPTSTKIAATSNPNAPPPNVFWASNKDGVMAKNAVMAMVPKRSQFEVQGSKLRTTWNIEPGTLNSNFDRKWLDFEPVTGDGDDSHAR